MKKIILGALAALFAANALAQNATVIDVEGKKLQVVNLDANGRVPWGGYTQIGNSVRSENDGAANTKAIIAAVGNNPNYGNKPYAASLCAGLNSGGNQDWYLPSVNELKGLFKSAKALGFGERHTYWSSTETSGTQAATVYMYNGTVYNNAKVDSHHHVCVRKAE